MAASSSSSSLQASILTFNGFRNCDASSSRPYCLLSLSSFRGSSGRNFNWSRLKQKKVKNGGNVCRAMVQQTVQGPSAAYAREMERLSAKESLLLALKDAGGFEALFTGRVTEMQRIDVMERVESKFTLSSKLSIEGPLRMKEEYLEGILDSPTVVEETVPDQLKGPFGQAVGAVQQLPVLVRDAISNGIRIPISGSLQRMFMISYLDEEILIIRDPFGAPEVMTRMDSSSYSVDEPALEYES
uniref:Plastid lipid-associated protein/fibrillin conserved domain-containing protein n=1 Tax=Chenopodium quinoa TaxID=63459 RepID=A0A803LM60_CHEQI